MFSCLSHSTNISFHAGFSQMPFFLVLTNAVITMDITPCRTTSEDAISDAITYADSKGFPTDFEDECEPGVFRNDIATKNLQMEII